MALSKYIKTVQDSYGSIYPKETPKKTPLQLLLADYETGANQTINYGMHGFDLQIKNELGIFKITVNEYTPTKGPDVTVQLCINPDTRKGITKIIYRGKLFDITPDTPYMEAPKEPIKKKKVRLGTFEYETEGTDEEELDEADYPGEPTNNPPGLVTNQILNAAEAYLGLTEQRREAQTAETIAAPRFRTDYTVTEQQLIDAQFRQVLINQAYNRTLAVRPNGAE